MDEPVNPALPPRARYLIFGVVAAAFLQIYVTQPVLPVLAAEFGISATAASNTVAAVLLGIALANLPFGYLADRLANRRLLILGGTIVTAAGLVAAAAPSPGWLVGARFVQGLFIPALTTCQAACLSRSLPLARLNRAMGGYVAATVIGGLGGRLLGGGIHLVLHWRWACAAAAGLLLVAWGAAAWRLPADDPADRRDLPAAPGRSPRPGGRLGLSCAVGFSAMFVFAAVFNYIPFYLQAPPLNASTGQITLIYLAYLAGVVSAPVAGLLGDRLGSGRTLLLGGGVMLAALAGTLMPRLWAIETSLVAVCAGFFVVHAAAVGLLNRHSRGPRGRDNAVYVLSYYCGAFAGIQVSGRVFAAAGWPGTLLLWSGAGLMVLLAGIAATRQASSDAPARRV